MDFSSLPHVVAPVPPPFLSLEPPGSRDVWAIHLWEVLLGKCSLRSSLGSSSTPLPSSPSFSIYCSRPTCLFHRFWGSEDGRQGWKVCGKLVKRLPEETRGCEGGQRRVLTPPASQRPKMPSRRNNFRPPNPRPPLLPQVFLVPWKQIPLYFGSLAPSCVSF